MILYVNGDSHSVGHGTGSDKGTCFDDLQYRFLGEAPHPDNLKFSYGALLANRLQASLVCQALPGGSLDRAIRTTKTFVYQTQGPIFVVLGVPSWERTEKFFQYCWWPINGDGHSHLPQGLHAWYRDWVQKWDWDGMQYYNDQARIHQQLIDFHQWLNTHGVPHLFFNTAQSFEINNKFDCYDWQGSFVTPYADSKAATHYLTWCREQNFKADQHGHFGKEAHVAWADHLWSHIKALC